MPTSSRFQPTDAIINVPYLLAAEHHLTDLTAPAMRAAIVLISRADIDGRFSITKPELEAAAELRLDNTLRFLDPLRGAAIWGYDEHLYFEDIQYKPGVRKRLPGIISGSISAMARMLLGRRPITVPIRVDELRAYPSVPAIILRLHLGSHFHEHPADVSVDKRYKDVDVHQLFGGYCKAARIKRADGSFDITLGRLSKSLLEPAATQINGICREFTVSLEKVPALKGVGRAIEYLDVKAVKLGKPVTIVDLQKASAWKRRVKGQ